MQRITVPETQRPMFGFQPHCLGFWIKLYEIQFSSLENKDKNPHLRKAECDNM